MTGNGGVERGALRFFGGSLHRMGERPAAHGFLAGLGNRLPGHAVEFRFQRRLVGDVNSAQGTWRRFANACSSVLAIAERETGIGNLG